MNDDREGLVHVGHEALSEKAWELVKPITRYAKGLVGNTESAQDAFDKIRAKVVEAQKSLTPEEINTLFATMTTHRIMEGLEKVVERHAEQAVGQLLAELAKVTGNAKSEDRPKIGFGAFMANQKPENN